MRKSLYYMKQNKKALLILATPKKKPTKRVAAKQAIRRKRPLHKHIALHPINILVLLCVGVLLVAFTISALADSYTVGAVVPAPPLTSPAVITYPLHNAQFSVQALTVGGTCPQNSYTNLSNNGVYVGTGMCSSNSTFQVATDLTAGPNQFIAQDYNITNAPGPSSPSVTVTYTAPSSPPTSVVPVSSPAMVAPVTLQVTQVDTSIPYISQSTNPIISDQPTMSGVAPPFSYITVVIHSNPYTCTTRANSQGYWSCTLSENLPPAIHTIDVTATTPEGRTITFPPFTVRVIAAAPAQAPPKVPFSLTSSYSYTVYPVGQAADYTIAMNGGTAPYALSINWGDGSTSTLLRQSAEPFTISHTYNWINAPRGTKTIKIEAVDTVGATSALQLIAVLRNPSYHNVVATATHGSGLWGIFSDTRPWLWILWPGYAIVMLLVLSFWLGERQELAQIMGKRRPKHHAARR
jgi:hypothetical protein